MNNKRFYVIERNYVGPNSEQHLNDDTVSITNDPARYNSSKEVCVEGWAGTTDDVAVYARGEFASMAEAVQFIFDEYKQGLRVVQDIALYDGAIAMYKIGKFYVLNKDATEEWLSDALVSDIKGDMTDDELQAIVDSWEDDANSQELTLTGAMALAEKERFNKGELAHVEGLAFTNVDYSQRTSRFVVNEDQYDLEELDENGVTYEEVTLEASDGHVCKAVAFLDPEGMSALSELNCHDFVYREWLLERLQAKLDNKPFIVMQSTKHDGFLIGRFTTEQEANDKAHHMAKNTPKAEKSVEGYQVVDIEKSKIFEPFVTLFVAVER